MHVSDGSVDHLPLKICINLHNGALVDCAGNGVTQNFFLPITLIACMVGLASVLAGIHHMRLFRSDSLAAAAASSLIAWLLVLLAMG